MDVIGMFDASAVLIVLLLSILLGAFGAGLICRHAERLGLVDDPCDRSSHVRPTPKGGGIGILAAFLFASMVLRLDVWLWVPALILSLVSFVGDRHELRPRLRLFLQFSAALSLLLGSFFCGEAALLGGSSPLMVISTGALLAVFVSGTANFYNFMDGINGIAGLSAVVAFGGLAMFALNSGEQSYGLLNLSLALACLGFLPFNLPRAKVFMGDVGSVLLGFVFAAQVVLLARNWTELFGLAALLLTFYFDELTTMAVRLMDREHLATPHRRHLYQLLVNEQGLPHYAVATAYAITQALLGSIFLMLIKQGLVVVLLGYGLSFVVFCFLTFRIRARAANVP